MSGFDKVAARQTKGAPRRKADKKSWPKEEVPGLTSMESEDGIWCFTPYVPHEKEPQDGEDFVRYKRNADGTPYCPGMSVREGSKFELATGEAWSGGRTIYLPLIAFRFGLLPGDCETSETSDTLFAQVGEQRRKARAKGRRR